MSWLAVTAFSRVLVRSGGLVLAVVVTGGQVLFVTVVLLFRYSEGCYVVIVWRVKKVVFWNI